jgi:gas vesicle protein
MKLKSKKFKSKNTMKDNSGKIILALLAGASAGIVAGLLMAPDSGTVSRGNLKNYAGKLSKDLEKTFQESLSKIDTSALLSSIGLGNKGGADENAADGSAAGSGTKKSWWC